jgi:hypothetical protein
MTSSGAVAYEEDADEEAGDDEASEARQMGSRNREAAVNFADVGGMEAVKEEIRMKILYPASEPGFVSRVREEDRRRSASVWASGLREDAVEPRDGGRDQSELPRAGPARDPRYVDGEFGEESASALRTRANNAPRCFFSTKSMPSRRIGMICVTARSGR